MIGIEYVKNELKTGIQNNPFSYDNTANVRRIHESLETYKPTRLIKIKSEANVKGILVKDESDRFGLKAFKGLGSVYAVFCVLCDRLGLDKNTVLPSVLKNEPYKSAIKDLEFITTTDGNHGKGVAWASKYFGCRSHVYMPKGTVEVRAQAIRDAGAEEVIITEMGYDDCVRYTAELAKRNGWCLVQDTSVDGGDVRVPEYIMQGYTTLLFEAAEQLHEQGIESPTHVFLQAGVGAMAGAVASAAVSVFGDNIVISIVEPENVACFYQSFLCADGKPHPAPDPGETIMAGLNCAEPCELAWKMLSSYAGYSFRCSDDVTKHGMRVLSKNGIVSGESGAVTTGLADIIACDDNYRVMKEKLGIDENSVILLISTEGDTDPENYKTIIGE